MNIFEQLKDIISDKTDKIKEDCENEKDFIPYMVQRWLSFYTPMTAQLLNNSTNVLWKAIDEKTVWYKLFTGVIPRSRFKNIKYIKKTKSEDKQKVSSNDVIEYIANSREISRREVKEYIKTGVIDVKALKKQLESN